jgi:flavin-dependent dehydrogenase
VIERWDAAVVGAGPAGSSAATVLAEAGRRVLLLEKDRFPRPKVCGEFLSADALGSLRRIGALETVESHTPERIGRGSIHPPQGPHVSFKLPSPAMGLSRLVFDDLLARRAAQAGAEVRFGWRAAAIERDPHGFRVRASAGGSEVELQARTVVGAWGRWDSLDRSLERRFISARRRFLGWSRDYGGETTRLAGQVRLYLFPGGYCGLSRVEGGTVNLAGVVSEETFRRAGAGWEGVCRHAGGANPSLAADLAALEPGPTGFLGTGPVYFTAKPPVENGILMVGDAAGVIDSFSGEGQAAALASGILAGETTAEGLFKELSTEDIARLYAKAWRARFSRRFRWSSALRLLVLNPSLGRLAGRLAGERLIRFGFAATRS